MKEKYFVRENNKYEEITKESAEGLVYSRQVFRAIYDFEVPIKFYLGMPWRDWFENREIKWKELSLSIINE